MSEGVYYFNNIEGGLTVFPNDTAPDKIDPKFRRYGEILVASQFEYQLGRFEAPLTSETTLGYMLEIGHVALTEMRRERTEPVSPVHEFINKHYDRMHILGIAPSEAAYRKFFGTFWHYREALGIHHGRATGKYSDWTEWHLSRYASEIHTSLPKKRKLKRSDIEAAHVARKGPGLKFIGHNFGPEPIAMMNEFLGYIDPRIMDEDDYYTWASRALEANEGELSTIMIAILSKRKFGPSTWSIYDHVSGGITGLRHRGYEIWRQREQEETDLLASLLKQFGYIYDIDLPHNLEPEVKRELALTAAKYLLAKECLPNHAHETYDRLARESERHVITSIRDVHKNRNSRLNRGEIELIATELGFYDIIWPMKGYLTNLKVPAAEIESYRQKNNLEKKLNRRRKRINE